FTPTPAANSNGSDRFTYTASDGLGGTDVGSVALTVNPAPDPPSAVNDSYTVIQNNTLVTASPGVLGNDTDPDGDALTATLVTSTTHGSLTLNANGSFSYTPVTDFLGTDGFTYRARDPGGLTSNASVTIPV